MRGAAVMLMTKPKKQEEEMEKGAAHVNLNDLWFIFLILCLFFFPSAPSNKDEQPLVEQGEKNKLENEEKENRKKKKKKKRKRLSKILKKREEKLIICGDKQPDHIRESKDFAESDKVVSSCFIVMWY